MGNENKLFPHLREYVKTKSFAKAAKAFPDVTPETVSNRVKAELATLCDIIGVDGNEKEYMINEIKISISHIIRLINELDGNYSHLPGNEILYRLPFSELDSIRNILRQDLKGKFINYYIDVKETQNRIDRINEVLKSRLDELFKNRE